MFCYHTGKWNVVNIWPRDVYSGNVYPKFIRTDTYFRVFCTGCGKTRTRSVRAELSDALIREYCDSRDWMLGDSIPRSGRVR